VGGPGGVTKGLLLHFNFFILMVPEAKSHDREKKLVLKSTSNSYTVQSLKVLKQ